MLDFLEDFLDSIVSNVLGFLPEGNLPEIFNESFQTVFGVYKAFSLLFPWLNDLWWVVMFLLSVQFAFWGIKLVLLIIKFIRG